MDITLPNGQVITGVPDGATKEEVKRKAISSGLATEADFGQAAPQGDAPRNMNFTPTVTPQKKGFGQKVSEFMQGGAEGERNIFSAPELNEMSMRAAKTGFGGLLTGDPKEIGMMIAENYPEAEFGDINGQLGVRLPSGDYLLQPEGIDPLDIARFGTDVAAFTPAGGIVGATAKQLGKGALVAGGTQTALQGAEAAVGGEFNPEDVALEAATQGGIQIGTPIVKAAYGAAKGFVSPLIDKVMAKFNAGAGDKPYQEIADVVASGKIGRVLPEIMADPEILKAANDLGINVNPGVYSKSIYYREMENAIKAVPRSKLSAQEKETVIALGQRADDLLLEWTGTVDKSAIAEDFTARMLDTVKSMEDEASILYKAFDDVIPPSINVIPDSTLAYISKQIEDLGGIENLDSGMARIYNQINKAGGPTYALLDKLRRDTGAALKGKGPFKDASQNELKALYGTLTDDTMKGAELFGLGEEVALAKDLVKRRKALEESLVGSLGKDLSKSLTAELGAGVKQLQSGKTGKFKAIMESIPEEDRQTIAISALNDLFAGGATKAKQFSLGGFVSSYEALARNERAANQLWQYIPPAARARVDAIYKVSKGLMDLNVKDLNNPSGSARAILGGMDAPNGILSKLYKVGSRMGAGAAATSPFDAGVSGAGFGLLTALQSAKTKVSAAADEMLTNPGFQEAMRKFAAGDSVAGNGILNSLKSTKTWLAAQSPSVKRSIARQGLIQYLTSEEQ